MTSEQTVNSYMEKNMKDEKTFCASDEGSSFNNLKSNFMEWNECLHIYNARKCEDMKGMHMNKENGENTTKM